jgi:hypothetical protein
MTAIPVMWACLYLTEVEGLTWRGNDYTAMKIVKAVKGEPINGFVRFPLGAGRNGSTRRMPTPWCRPLAK